MVFSPWLFCTDSSTVRWPLYSARLSTSCGPSTTSATWHSDRLAVAPGHDDVAELVGDFSAR
jgi:hypothetical protein